MQWYFAFLLFFSLSAFAEDSPNFDYRCVDEIRYTSQMITARQGGIEKQTLVDDLTTAEIDNRLTHYSVQWVIKMFDIIELAYANDTTTDTVEGVQQIYQNVNDWCSNKLPPEDLEDRRNYDEDGDGYPDFDSNGNRLEKLSV